MTWLELDVRLSLPRPAASAAPPGPASAAATTVHPPSLTAAAASPAPATKTNWLPAAAASFNSPDGRPSSKVSPAASSAAVAAAAPATAAPSFAAPPPLALRIVATASRSSEAADSGAT